MQNFNITEMMGALGANPLDAMEKLSELITFLPKVKSMLPKLREWEKTQNLKEGEYILYGAILNKSATEIICTAFVMKETENGQAILTEQKFSVKCFEKLESILPAGL